MPRPAVLLPLLAAALTAHALTLTVPATTLPCVGSARTRGRELTVVGTAHTPWCRSAAEVRAVIAEVQPDVVVLELDQARLEALLVDTEARSGGVQFGSEFAAGLEAAVGIGCPVVLGDAKGGDTLGALTRVGWPLLRPRRFAADLARALSPGPPPAGTTRVDAARALADDLGKLLPLALSTLPTIALLPLARSDSTGGSSAAVSAAALCLAAAAGARVLEALLFARDDVLSASALRALDVASGLREGRLLRRQFFFSTAADVLAAAAAEEGPLGADETPFFTLKRPLAEGDERTLNLFEPRWLALMDRLAADQADGKLPGATLGCLLAANRYYSNRDGAGTRFAAYLGDRDGDEGGDDGDAERRFADLVVHRRARLATVVSVAEGTRSVSGNRKLTVVIRGEGTVHVDDTTLRAAASGYLVASAAPAPDDDTEAWVNDDDDRPVRAVCVVGLAHANGVLDRVGLA